ncbi:MAG: VIT family protein [Limnobacter sp.]|nr:VIT family protein [Limnobacter sp.]
MNTSVKPAPHHHNLDHIVHRIGWLRAATLGANDGIISIASLLVGMAAGQVGAETLLLSGVAGVVAGSLSMAAGEYVSVSSQADAEKAELDMEAAHLASHPEFELNELTRIYVDRGLDEALARQVASDLMRHDPLGAHARDELGITESMSAKPLQAAWSSALSFCAGGALPLLMAYLGTLREWGTNTQVLAISISALLALVLTGYVVARAGKSPVLRSVLRITLWGGLALGLSWAAGFLFDLQLH